MLTKAVRLQRRTSALQRWKEPFVHLRTDNLYYANIIITIIIIISCYSSSFTYNQSDLKLMRCSLCLSSRLDGWQNHRGGVTCKQRTSTEDWIPVILKTRKNAVPSWLQWLVSFSNPKSIKLYSFSRSFSEKSRTRDRGRKIPLTQRHIYSPYYNVTISSRLIHKREFLRTTLSKPNLLTQPYLLIVITWKLTTE